MLARRSCLSRSHSRTRRSRLIRSAGRPVADFQFNVSVGREVELYNRVDSNGPTNSAFIMLVLALSGIEADATLKDYDTVAAILAGTTNEVTNTNYARKT